MTPGLSIVVPVLNDAPALQVLLSRLHATAQDAEIVVVDGGSRDGSVQMAVAAGCVVAETGPGRGQQLAAGVARAAGHWIWMLHADAAPSPAATAHLLRLAVSGGDGWGRFSVTFEAGPLLGLVAWSMNWRSRLTGICTGDQGIFVSRPLLEAVGGVPPQPLMEDVELSRRLKKLAPPDPRPERIGASPRRWQRHGTVATILSMWRFRLRYWLGADAVTLAREYYRQ